MTKVYLVTMNECDENGRCKLGGKILVDEVFTNKKKAIAFVNAMNKAFWKYEKTWYWWWEERTISKVDYTKEEI